MYRDDLRWVCQWKNHGNAVCNGQFRPSGYGGKRGTRCRLYERCRGRDPQLETGYPTQYRDQKQLKPPKDELRSRAHDEEQIAVRRCFFPDCRKGETARRYREKPWAFPGRPRLQDMVPGYVPLNAAKEPPPPPCGGDHDNCPYDGACRYPDWGNEDVYIAPSGQRVSREARRRGKRAYAARRAERMRTDPAFAEREREKGRRYSLKANAKAKFVKAGGTPARFERLWARAAGDRETFIALSGAEGVKIIWKERKGDGERCRRKRP